MDDKCVSFITCVNDEEQYEICRRHIESLAVPQGFRLELRQVRGAKGAPSAYNQAMRASEARFKVYLHQDVFILNPDLIGEMTNLFDRFPRLGLMGVVGASRLPKSGIWFEDGLHSFGKVREYRKAGFDPFRLSRRKERVVRFRPVRRPFRPVMVVDGLIMMTQYDLPWREELYDDFEYYEGPQCLEFIKRGYLVGIPHQKNPWCMHRGKRVPETSEQHKARWARIRANADLFTREYEEYVGKSAADIVKHGEHLA